MDPKIAAQQINKIIERIIRLEDEIFWRIHFQKKIHWKNLETDILRAKDTGAKRTLLATDSKNEASKNRLF